MVEDEEECDQLQRDEVKKAIIQLSQREMYKPMDTWTDKCIRVKHKTYVPFEVNKDRNGRMIYTHSIRRTSLKSALGQKYEPKRMRMMKIQTTR